MRISRVVAGLTAAVTAALGVSLASPGPAAAAEAGSWRAYGNTNPVTSSPSTWYCAPSGTIATNVAAQICGIRSVDRTAVQAAVIVRNNRSSLYSVSATMSMGLSGTSQGTWECRSSGVAANSWSVCFGRTLSQSGKVDVEGWANNAYLGVAWDV